VTSSWSFLSTLHDMFYLDVKANWVRPGDPAKFRPHTHTYTHTQTHIKFLFVTTQQHSSSVTHSTINPAGDREIHHSPSRQTVRQSFDRLIDQINHRVWSGLPDTCYLLAERPRRGPLARPTGGITYVTGRKTSIKRRSLPSHMSEG